MEYCRGQLQVIRKRLAEKRKFIQVIIGPRQVGKTTIATQLISQIKIPHLFVSADGVINSDNVWINQQWENARTLHKQNENSPFLLIIDEIQKIDNWSEWVKAMWDEDTKNNCNILVLLLGSSRILMQKGLTESLAGRFETIYVGHWTFAEMNTAFGWDENKFAWYGGYPGPAEIIDDVVRWKNYINDSLIETSISKDILMLTRIDKPALLKRLFELGCNYSAQILSYTKILGQLQDAGNTTTLSHYLDLLNAAGLLGGIEKFSVEKIRQRASSPKFQVHNMALFCIQKNETYNEAITNPALWGRVVESAIGAHLLNYSITHGFKLFYWKESNNEVDFVIQKNNKVVAMEIKSGLSQKNRGMALFKKKYPAAKVLLIGQNGLPWKEFIKINPEELF
jgi:uncharacterized protein